MCFLTNSLSQTSCVANQNTFNIKYGLICASKIFQISDQTTFNIKCVLSLEFSIICYFPLTFFFLRAQPLGHCFPPFFLSHANLVLSLFFIPLSLPLVFSMPSPFSLSSFPFLARISYSQLPPSGYDVRSQQSNESRGDEISFTEGLRGQEASWIRSHWWCSWSGNFLIFSLLIFLRPPRLLKICWSPSHDPLLLIMLCPYLLRCHCLSFLPFLSVAANVKLMLLPLRTIQNLRRNPNPWTNRCIWRRPKTRDAVSIRSATSFFRRTGVPTPNEFYSTLWSRNGSLDVGLMSPLSRTTLSCAASSFELSASRSSCSCFFRCGGRWQTIAIADPGKARNTKTFPQGSWSPYTHLNFSFYVANKVIVIFAFSFPSSFLCLS